MSSYVEIFVKYTLHLIPKSLHRCLTFWTSASVWSPAAGVRYSSDGGGMYSFLGGGRYSGSGGVGGRYSGLGVVGGRYVSGGGDGGGGR